MGEQHRTPFMEKDWKGEDDHMMDLIVNYSSGEGTPAADFLTEPSFDLDGLEELHSILHGDVPAPAPLPVPELNMDDYSMIPEEEFLEAPWENHPHDIHPEELWLDENEILELNDFLVPYHPASPNEEHLMEHMDMQLAEIGLVINDLLLGMIALVTIDMLLEMIAVLHDEVWPHDQDVISHM